MRSGRRIHAHIKSRIEAALCGRSVQWLTEESGVPQSTLAGQMASPKFSLDVLLKVAAALEEDITYFLPDEVLAAPRPPLDDTLSKIEATIGAWRKRRHTGCDPDYDKTDVRRPRSDSG